MKNIIFQLPEPFIRYMGKDGLESISNYYREAECEPTVGDFMGWRRYSSLEEAIEKQGLDKDEIQTWDDFMQYFPCWEVMENGDTLVATDNIWKDYEN